MAAKCNSCDQFDFEGCNKKPPCPDVIELVDCIGVIFKSKGTKNEFDANLEATLQENTDSEEDQFYATCYAIATKVDLKLVTISEFKLLQRVVKLKTGRHKRLSYSDNKFVLIPDHWANEIRVLKKYFVRLHTLDLSLDHEFIREESEIVDLKQMLWIDGGTSIKI